MNSTFDRVVDVRPAYRALGLSDDAPRPVNLRAFRLANAFGAFGSVNDRKNALVIEGKRDGEDWREYDFRALPADPTAKLRQVRVSQYTQVRAPQRPSGVWTREQSGVLLKPTDAASLKVALDKYAV
ncbi:hypothetical protein JL720_9501 [Aureococcus anophagefferens]|nr:hypothetical protein JL720_9501 [Aureococcus anophagefferens]